jgi:hypothetical protein
MKILKKLALYAIPLFSMAIFMFYVWTAGGPGASAWGGVHGIHVEIVENYRNVNLVSLLAWTFVLLAVVSGKRAWAQLAAVFAVGYVLCDEIFYVPMARIAGEPFPWDQFSVLAVQTLYALLLPRISARDTLGTQ